MMREYLRVTPTSESLPVTEIPQVLASLHKLTTTASPSLAQKLNPLHSTRPLHFEFLALSEGADEPVEFLYGADEHLDTLAKRLQSIYPSTFDIERVEIDLTSKLIQPVEYTQEEFVDRVHKDSIHYEFAPDEQRESPAGPADERTADEEAPEGEDSVADGGTVSESNEQYLIEHEDGTISVAPPNTLPADQPLTTLTKPTATGNGTVLARPALEMVSPVGVRWYGNATRKEDWMTLLTPFVEDATDSLSTPDQPGDSLASLVDHLIEAEHPIAFQVVFQRKSDWTSDAEIRKENLIDGRDTLFQEWVGPFLEVEEQPSDRSERQLSEPVKQRVERITAKTPKRTFTVNIRAIAVPTDDDAADNLDARMDALRPVFDPLDGPFYGIEGQRLQSKGFRQTSKEKNARKSLTRLLHRDLDTGRGKKRPGLVLNGNELAHFVIAPSSEQLTVEGTRGTRAEQQSRNPLPRPHQDLMRQFRGGMDIGFALDENGEPEEQPTALPPSVLPTHYGRFGTTGSGKSKALINDILSLYENTDGPVILIDPKGDGMSQNYMRAHARRFGTTDLEENVVHFPLPDVLPGFSFFDLEPSVENGRRREDAVQRKADHYEEILKLVMGTDRYERATVSPTLIKTLIKALFDEEHGRENGLYRESTDYFAHRQLEHIVDQLWEAGPPQANLGEAPQSSDEEVVRTIRRQLQLDSNTFANVMGGVGNRLAYISQDTHLRRIFNNTENQFDFRDILDENKVILFDLGDLRDEAARIMTGVILTNLDDALKERKRDLEQYPDDYVVNLLIDEAASVVVSDIMNDLLEKGRSFGLSVGLSMQFPEQMEVEGGRKVYLNALNNIGSSLVGKINVDRELAQAMAHEEMDPVDFANRIRSLPRGEWIASLPSPTFGETGPYPFSVKPLPIPAGHPESESPLDNREEDRFENSLSTIHERASDDFGVPETGVASSERSPEAVQEILGTANQDLDQALAKTIRIIQLREGVRDENGWVAVEDVDAELRSCFDEIDNDPPDYDALADIRERSRLLDVDLDAAADELLVCLTDVGETAAAPDTGDTRAAGSDAHDAVLLEVEAALTALGFRVTILTQDGNEQPDAKATHPDLDETFAIEAETTTPENPVKVLTNLRKAQDAEHIPLFVVRPGETETYWAERVERILSPPVQQLTNGETRFYTHDGHITFRGGATEQGGVTAVRPTAGETDSGRTVWSHEDNELVLKDSDGAEYVRLSSLADASKDRVPATYSYDHAADEYVVYEQGEQHVYDTKAAFEAEWVRIKKPFVPEAELPTPEYGPESYAIVILPDDGKPVVYDNGETRSVETLFEIVTPSGDGGAADQKSGTAQQTETPQIEEIADDPDAVVKRFADIYLIEDAESTVAAGEVYERYDHWAERNNIEPDTKSWFARRLSNHVTFERTTQRENGDPVRYYVGLAFGQCGSVNE
ncbi:ATP-binding protein [Halobellus sp. H-GB7]|uniref:ATP-binding protein n=1 Tax=Halobellus sp. H-GB7 TaxID=3069756 RepID=UPI0027B6C815|nr:ATP-binding protein [Halobellus sp. H-GB7]MDQ2055284.1 ATP-binding protein [Halobellus sp. H-GB7]